MSSRFKGSKVRARVHGLTSYKFKKVQEGLRRSKKRCFKKVFKVVVKKVVKKKGSENQKKN